MNTSEEEEKIERVHQNGNEENIEKDMSSPDRQDSERMT